MDAGLKIPKGILQGNLKEYGNYHQCLGIHEEVSEDMEIQGKFCLISVPVNSNSRINPQMTLDFDPNLLQLPLQTKQKLEERNLYMDKMRSVFGNTIEYQRMDPNTTLPDIEFQLGVCVPKCIGVTWYLAIDVQLHILSPIILFWVFGRAKRLAWSALFLALFLSLTASTAYIFANTFSDEGLKYFVYVYVNILTRAPPFFVGMVFGYALHLARGKKIRMPMHLHVPLTALSISLLALILYCHYKRDDPNFDNQVVKDLFQSFLRPFWAAGLGWIIYACYNGYAVTRKRTNQNGIGNGRITNGNLPTHLVPEKKQDYQ
ncbi:unnamed protein product [Danaus chrysippus]|uniref:(African queen) hypothetical protein n=1 Tax=Danaus chrysippus TaxID=151541 RepID=A0A8J2R2C3_9NEOP|nr:unnamed protein product [Danaus chrysippus]